MEPIKIRLDDDLEEHYKAGENVLYLILVQVLRLVDNKQPAAAATSAGGNAPEIVVESGNDTEG